MRTCRAPLWPPTYFAELSTLVVEHRVPELGTPQSAIVSDVGEGPVAPVVRKLFFRFDAAETTGRITSWSAISSGDCEPTFPSLTLMLPIMRGARVEGPRCTRARPRTPHRGRDLRMWVKLKFSLKSAAWRKSGAALSTRWSAFDRCRSVVAVVLLSSLAQAAGSNKA